MSQAEVTNGESASDPDPKVTTIDYTARGQKLLEVKANQNTVDYTYHLDGLLKHQVEQKANGTIVTEHSIDYDPNGNRVTDVARTMNADNHAAYQDRTHAYSYDPRDRIAEVVKTDTSSGATLSTETYVHDAANNVISQTLEGVTTTFGYDRTRLLTATSGGQTAAYNYDPFGRLDTVTAAGQVLERYEYDGFDRIAEHTTTTDTGGSETTSYSYDPLDRTTSRTDSAGSAGEETTDFAYLGLSGEVLTEEIGGQVQKSYQYSPWGQRLSQVKFNTDGTEEDGFYGYNPPTDVETLTDETGNTKATYGYTAYGNNDESEFTGVDAPDPQQPGAEPYNVYRYNAKRWDPATGSYDMGFRDYSPGLNRFLSRDMYTGALADLNLATNPWNGNRYAFTGGNPITGIELDGHIPIGPTDSADSDREYYQQSGMQGSGWRVDSYGGWTYHQSYNMSHPGGRSRYTEIVPSKEARAAGVTSLATWQSWAGGQPSALDHALGPGVLILAPEAAVIGDAIDCVEGNTDACMGLGTAAAFKALLRGISAPWRAADEGADAAHSGSRIAANQAAGNAARDALAAAHPGSLIEQSFSTTAGVRRLDILTQGGLGIESKVGRTSLTAATRSQIAKDTLLLRNGDVTGHRVGVLAQRGHRADRPDGPLADALSKAGIPWSLAP